MSDQLDLYGRSGPRVWPKIVAVIGVAVLFVGAAAYKAMTTATPVTSDAVVDIFRAEKKASRSAEAAKEATRGSSKPGDAGAKKEETRATRASSKQQTTVVAAGGGSTARPAPAGADDGDGQQVRSAAAPDQDVRRLPREGVYSWDTNGYESAGGARRNFPRETQRIITLDGDRGWKSHHYFSEERESWTDFVLSDEGASIAYQRNYVKFGPVTEDASITFSPPMLVGPATPKVGQTWSGEWRGKTYGSYEGRTFEHTFLNIGGTRVEAWGVEVRTHLRGEQEGEVLAQVWIAPKYGLTVKEHFVQDVKADVGSYHAEWTMTLKSLEPRR